MSQEALAAVLIIFQTLPPFTEVQPDRCWHFLLPTDEDKDRRGKKNTGCKCSWCENDIYFWTHKINIAWNSGIIRILSMLFLVSTDQRHWATEEDNKSVVNSVNLLRESNSNSFGKATTVSTIVTNDDVFFIVTGRGLKSQSDVQMYPISNQVLSLKPHPIKSISALLYLYVFLNFIPPQNLSRNRHTKPSIRLVCRQKWRLSK